MGSAVGWTNINIAPTKATCGSPFLFGLTLPALLKIQRTVIEQPVHVHVADRLQAFGVAVEIAHGLRFALGLWFVNLIRFSVVS